MSGHKMATVTISQDEYQRLYDAERKMIHELNETIAFHPEVMVEENIPIFEKMMKFTQPNTILDLPSNIQSPQFKEQYRQNVELQQLQIQAIEDQLKNEIYKSNEYDLSNSTDINDLSQQIGNIRAEFDTIVKQMTSRNTNKFFSRQKKKEEFSQIKLQLIDEFGQLLNTLSQSVEDGSINSDDYSRLANIYDSIQQTNSIDRSTGSISLLQTGLSDARYHWNKIELDRSLRYYAKERLIIEGDNLEQFFKARRTIEGVNRSGEGTGVYLDLMEWSDGMYEALLNDITKLNGWLHDDGTLPTFSEISTIQDKFLDYKDQFENTIETAHCNAINTQLKYEVANTVLLALVAEGFFPLQGDYVSNEGKERYYAQAQDATGNLVTIYIDNEDDNPIGSKISLLSSDYHEKYRHEVLLRAKAIREAVQSYGLQISDYEELPVNSEPAKPVERSKKFLQLP
jgi:hypothetical protein